MTEGPLKECWLCRGLVQKIFDVEVETPNRGKKVLLLCFLCQLKVKSRLQSIYREICAERKSSGTKFKLVKGGKS